MMKRALAFPLVGAMLLTSTAFAQTTAPSSSGPTVSAPAGPTEFLTQEKAGEWRASKLKGVEVYNNNHERIGEIRDVLVDGDGKVDSVVIGIGGFLGLDEHDVALRFDQISWVDSTSRNGAEMPRAYPDHAVVKMTKDQLKAFPEFHYAR